MGQLITEAHALLSARLAPEEVLEHLDEIVTLLDDAESGLAAGYSALKMPTSAAPFGQLRALRRWSTPTSRGCSTPAGAQACSATSSRWNGLIACW